MRAPTRSPSLVRLPPCVVAPNAPRACKGIGEQEEATTADFLAMQPFPTSTSPAPTTRSPRAILHVDVDCFYAQVEMARNQHVDRSRPLAVTQKVFGRDRQLPWSAGAGVGKLMRIDKAKAVCPELVLVSGEDLTPYREASSQIFAALSAFGPCQKLGLDELFVDVTAAAHADQQAMAAGHHEGWSEQCKVHSASAGTRSAESEAGTGTDFRPQDLRATAAGGAADPSDGASSVEAADASLALLRAASHVAVRCKQAVWQQAGLTVSVGVASTKLLAKLVSGLHKPDGLSALRPSEAKAFLEPLDVRVLPGVGSAAAARLYEAGQRTPDRSQRRPWAGCSRF